MWVRFLLGAHTTQETVCQLSHTHPNVPALSLAYFIQPHVMLASSLAIVYIATALAFFSYEPIWDGYGFIKLCYVPATEGILWDCANHSSVVNNAIFGTVLQIHPSVHSIYLTNLTLGIAGIWLFYLVLWEVFADRLSRSQTVLIAFLLGLNPIMMAHVIQPSLDFALPLYTTLLLFALWKKQFFLATLAGILLSFTKETGLVVYGVTTGLYLLVMFDYRKLLLLLKGLRCDFRKRVPNLAGIAMLPIPLILFFVYSLVMTEALHVQELLPDGSFMTLLSEMFSFNETPAFFSSQLSSIAILNFSWVMAACIILGFTLYTHQIAQKKHVTRRDMSYSRCCVPWRSFGS